MTDTSPRLDSWPPCPAGELEGLARRLKSQRRNRAAARAAGIAAIVVVLAVGISLTVQRTQKTKDQFFGKIACSDVQKAMDDFMVGRLDTELSQRIQEHLELCPVCGPDFRRMQSDASQTAGLERWHATRVDYDHVQSLLKVRQLARARFVSRERR